MDSDKTEKQLVGSLIRVLREFCSPAVTQEQLDLLIDREPGYVNRLENGTRPAFGWRTYGIAVVKLIQKLNSADQLVDRLTRDPNLDSLIKSIEIVLEKGEISGGERSDIENIEKRLKLSGSGVIIVVDESVRKSLPGKLKDDYQHAYINTRKQLQEQTNRVVSGLRKSLCETSKDVRLPEINLIDYFPNTEDLHETSRQNASWCIFSGAWNGVLRDRALQFLYGHKIRFGSAAIHPSVEAAICYLRQQGLDIEIDSNAKHGIEQVDQIETGNSKFDYDFMVLADANMFQRGRKNAFSYLYAVPIFGQTHHFIDHQETKGRARQLIVANDSSAHHQLKLGIEVGDFENIDFVDIGKLGEIISNLESNQSVLAWEPLRSAVGQKHGRKTRQVSSYELTTSLYCNRRYWDAKRNIPLPYVGIFLEAFISAWNHTKICREETCFMLASDHGFLRRYCSAI